MDSTEEFLASMVPRLTAADTALHNGDATLRKTLWSTREPVTLFGAALTATGWPEVDASFDWLASRFSECEHYECEVISAAASGDLAYIVAYEHTTASIGGAPAEPYSLRVTTILRREDGEWKITHRHGDPVADSDSARDRLLGKRADEPVA